MMKQLPHWLKPPQIKLLLLLMSQPKLLPNKPLRQLLMPNKLLLMLILQQLPRWL
jgi:hypothetical protein